MALLKCSLCGEFKKEDEFYSSDKYRCKICNKNDVIKRYKTRRGYLIHSYNRIKRKVNYHKCYVNRRLEFSLNEFLKFSFHDKSFNNLFKAWKNSNYNHIIAPTVDRIDNDGNYTIKNIQFITKRENSKKVFKDIKYHKCKSVVCINTGEEYPSIIEAAKKNKLVLSSLYAHIEGKRNSIYGLKFKYLS